MDRLAAAASVPPVVRFLHALHNSLPYDVMLDYIGGLRALEYSLNGRSLQRWSLFTCSGNGAQLDEHISDFLSKQFDVCLTFETSLCCEHDADRQHHIRSQLIPAFLVSTAKELHKDVAVNIAYYNPGDRSEQILPHSKSLELRRAMRVTHTAFSGGVAQHQLRARRQGEHGHRVP